MSAKVEALPVEIPADDFHALEEKVYRTIEMYKAAREGKMAAERDVQRLRAQLEAKDDELQKLQRDVVRLKKEREDVKARVEKMLLQIEEVAAAS